MQASGPGRSRRGLGACTSVGSLGTGSSGILPRAGPAVAVPRQALSLLALPGGRRESWKEDLLQKGDRTLPGEAAAGTRT